MTALLLLAACATAPPPPPPAPVAFDHLWIVVQPGAPERAALERAGFQFDPRVNRHDGQGTASITAEFENAYLELLWPDASVPVSPALQRGAEKFRQRMLWRTTGWSPIGINLHATGSGTVPLPSWQVSPGWMPKGEAITILTPRDDTTSPSISIHPRAQQMPPPELLAHRIGVRRVTAVRLIEPRTYTPIDAVNYLRDQRVIRVATGDAWAVELTFDNNAQHQSKDFRPELPLIIHY